MKNERFEQLRQRLAAHKRTLAITHDQEIARLCLIEIAKDQIELDRITLDRIEDDYGMAAKAAAE
jgi:hypothetical protein